MRSERDLVNLTGGIPLEVLNQCVARQIDLVMVYYVDEQATSLSDLSDSWKGRKLPGKKEGLI